MTKIDGSMLNLFIFIVDIIEVTKYSYTRSWMQNSTRRKIKLADESWSLEETDIYGRNNSASDDG